MIASPAWNCSTKTGTPNSPKATVCSTRSSTAAGQATTTTEHPTAPCACCTRPSRPTPRPSTTGPSPRSSTPAASNMARYKMPCARSPIQACGRWRTTATTGKPSATTSPWPRNCAPIRKPANTYTRPMRTDWPIRPSRNGTDATIHGIRRRSNRWTKWSTWRAWNSGGTGAPRGCATIRPNRPTWTGSRACKGYADGSNSRCQSDSPITTSPRSSAQRGSRPA